MTVEKLKFPIVDLTALSVFEQHEAVEELNERAQKNPESAVNVILWKSPVYAMQVSVDLDPWANSALKDALIEAMVEAEGVLRNIDADMGERCEAAENLRLAAGLEPWHVRYPPEDEDEAE